MGASPGALPCHGVVVAVIRVSHRGRPTVRSNLPPLRWSRRRSYGSAGCFHRPWLSTESRS